MFATALKGLFAHKLRLASTAPAAGVGGAFLAGPLVLTDTIRKTFDTVFSGVYAGTDGQVRAPAAFEGPNNTGEQRGRVPESLVPVVAKVPDVAVAEGQVLGYTRLVGKNGDALGNPENGAPTLGGNWSSTPQLNAFTVVQGAPPRAPDGVVIDKKSAQDGNLTVGDTTTVLLQGPPQKVRISGIV